MKIFFLGWTAQYEQQFITYLSEHYEIEHLAEPKGLSRLHRIATRLLGRAYSVGLFGRIYCRMKKFGKADLLICNEGQIHRKINPGIIKSFPGQKALLVRDLVDAQFLNKWSPDFDATYSFDREQCEKLGMNYMNQFMPMGYKQSSIGVTPKILSSEPTALFIGREKGRGTTLLDLASALKASGCKIDFRILVDESTPNKTPYHITSVIDYRKSLEATLQSDVLVEINQPGQSGFTLRTLEAAYYGKKLITNNESIEQSPLYHPNNVHVLDGKETWDEATLRQFLSAPFQPVTKEIIYEYSPDYMLESLMTNHGAKA